MYYENKPRNHPDLPSTINSIPIPDSLLVGLVDWHCIRINPKSIRRRQQHRLRKASIKESIIFVYVIIIWIGPVLVRATKGIWRLGSISIEECVDWKLYVDVVDHISDTFLPSGVYPRMIEMSYLLKDIASMALPSNT
jgi:hypothetical protein